MSGVSSLIALANGARAFFVAHSVSAVVTPVGQKQRFRVINQGPGGGSRVVFMPGAVDASGALKSYDGGSLMSPKINRVNPRPLVHWDRINTISVWGVNAASPQDEELQLAATEDLFEWVVRAVHNAVDPGTGSPVGLANVVWGDVMWTTPPMDGAFGKELLVTFRHNAVLFDTPIDTTTPQPSVARNPLL